MSRQDIAAARAASILDREGEDVTYTPSGGAARTIKCFVQIREQLESRIFDDGEQTVQVADVGAAHDATTGVTTINEADKFTFAGFAWAPHQWHRQGGSHVIEVVRNVGVRKSNRERIERGM